MLGITRRREDFFRIIQRNFLCDLCVLSVLRSANGTSLCRFCVFALKIHTQVFLPSTTRMMRHCCAIDSTLLTVQYSTRPAGKNRNMAVNMNGRTMNTFC